MAFLQDIVRFTEQQAQYAATPSSRTEHQYGDMVINPHIRDTLRNGKGVNPYGDMGSVRHHDSSNPWYDIMSQVHWDLLKSKSVSIWLLFLSFFSVLTSVAFEYLKTKKTFLLGVQVVVAGMLVGFTFTHMLDVQATESSMHSSQLSALKANLKSEVDRLQFIQQRSEFLDTQVQVLASQNAVVMDDVSTLKNEVAEIQARITTIQKSPGYKKIIQHWKSTSGR